MTTLPARPGSPFVVLVLWLSRLVERVSQALHLGSGGVIGGRVIQTLAPGTLRTCAVGRDVFLVSGTNGKTTTSAYLRAALGVLGPAEGNTDGANTRPGLMRTMARATSHQVVLETDEGWVPWALGELDAPTVVLTNLSRDQLHRHHEVGRVAATWRGALGRAGVAVANADDPAVVHAALAAPTQVWVAAGVRWSQDDRVCPACGRTLAFPPTGWHCVCGLHRPEPDWWLEGDELVGPGVRVGLTLSLPGEANLANAAMAVAVAARQGADPQQAAAALSDIGSVAGRYDVVEHAGRRARLLLAKNPASWIEALSVIRDSPGPVVLAFNCDGVDGRDASWLYDVTFDELTGLDVVVTGRRGTDLVVRLEIGGHTAVRRAATVTEALELLPEGDVQLIANYTAFQQARQELRHGR